MDGDAELVAFLQRFLGHCLTGDISEQVWAFFWGKGANGKTTLLNVIAFILGDYARDTPAETFLKKDQGGGPSNDLARLRGARLITANEPPEGRAFDPGVLKKLSGQTTITARFLFHEAFEYMPEGKLIFCANKKLTIPDNSEAFWRRPLLVPFVRQFQEPGKDPKLPSKLAAETPGIFNWLIQGCLAWQREGLNPPTTIQEAVQEYRTDNDILAGFLEECCEMDPDLTVPVSSLYPAYKTHCENNQIRKPLSQQKFNEDLNSRAGLKQDRLSDKSRTRIWRGIALKGDGDSANVVRPEFRKKSGKSCRDCAHEGEPCPKGRHDREAEKFQYYEGMQSCFALSDVLTKVTRI